MEKPHPSLKAVIFDMDGTLIDTERIGHASWDHAGEDVGLFVPQEVKDRMVGRNIVDIGRLVEEAFPEEDTGPLLERANFHYHRLVSEQPPPIKLGTVDLLDWLQDMAVPLALATSSRHWQAEDKLGRTGLLDYFPVIIGGDEVDRGKPDPEVFERAAEGLKVPIRNCAVFEDSGPGIEGANRSGAFAVLVPEAWPVDPGIALFAHEVLSDLTEARPLLSGMLD